MPAQDWQPNADLATLRARSQLLTDLRAFFAERRYLEVETPALNRSGTVDPNIDSIWAQGDALLLHTSPEFAMKRLLAAGSGAIYQIAKVYRREEAGRLHNPEFTLLEWYRPGFDHHLLMDEVESLFHWLALSSVELPFPRLAYADCFQQWLGIDIQHDSNETLQRCVQAQGIALQGELTQRDQWLDLLMGEVIGPKLGQELPCFVYDYPASQAALARIRPGPPDVAERFELYWQGIELANGFHELIDASEQYRRLTAEAQSRREQGKDTPAIDEYFLQALHHGLPACAGVALGVDRLLMLMLGKNCVAEVLSFAWDRI